MKPVRSIPGRSKTETRFSTEAYPLVRRCARYHKGMDRTALSTGVVLGVAGAILKFAVATSVRGFSLDTAGIILMVAGGFLALVGIAGRDKEGRE